MQKTAPSGSWTEKVIVDLSLLRTLSAIQQKPQEPSFWEVIDSFISLAYAILTVLRTLLQWLVACLIFRFRIFILMVQTKKKIYMNCGSSTSSWKPWRGVSSGPIFMMRDIYVTSIWKTHEFPSSSRNTAKDI